MSPLSSFAVLALPALGFAQGLYGAGTPAKAASSSVAPAASMSTDSSSSVKQVMVGPGGNFVFSPNSFTANVGDQVEFMFHSGNIHSVVQGSSSDPCTPSGPTAFFSDFPKGGGAPFTVTINSTDPIYFYCSAPTHCQMGMVGVINPGSMSQEQFAAAASKTSNSKAPSQIQGGVFASASSGGSSGGSSSSSAASSVAPAPTGAASGTQALTFAGIAIPFVAAGWAML